MLFKAREGYKRVLDPLTSTYHYIPEGGRPHQFDKCWCHPVVNIRLGTTHHYYQAVNKAKC